MFLFCVRPLGTADPTLSTLEDTNRASELQCMQPPSALRSGVANDGRSINFGMPTFLGIPNPMEFPVTASMWEVSVYSVDLINMPVNNSVYMCWILRVFSFISM